MHAVRGSELLRLPVRLNGILLGWPVDLIVDPDTLRAVGLDVRCGDEVHRFLPLVAAEPRADEIHVDSALMLLDDVELSFYRERGRTLRELRGAAVERHGEPEGVLADLVLDAGGAVTELVLAGEPEECVPADDAEIGETRRRVPTA